MRNQPEPHRSPSQKPAWFELLDSDAPSAQVTKVNKKLPIIAAVVAGGILASGALLAGASAENPTGQRAIAAIDQTTNSPVATAAPTETPADPSVGVPTPGKSWGDDDEGDDHDGRNRHEGGGDRDRDHDDD